MQLSQRQLILLVLLTLVWGLNWPVMKLGVADYPPLTFRAISIWLGIPVLGLAMVLLKVPFFVPRDKWRELFWLAAANMFVWHALIILAVKNLSSGDPIQITFGDRPAVRPQWAARGDRIIFSIQGDGIWSVAALGGDPRRIVERGWNADLSPDGERLTFERSSQVLVAKADGTGITPLTGFPEAVMPYYGDAWPTFSPDGRSIAVFLGEEGRYGDYWVLPSQGGKAVRLTTDLAEGGAPAWSPDGNFLVVSSARSGSMNLWRVPVSGGAPEALTTGAGDDLDPVVTPDGAPPKAVAVGENWWRAGLGNNFNGPTGQGVETSGYVKLREISVAYTWESAKIRDLTGFTSVDFRVAGRNLHTWADYNGIDPETNLEGAYGIGRGQDYFNNPQTRSFIFTISLNH